MHAYRHDCFEESWRWVAYTTNSHKQQRLSLTIEVIAAVVEGDAVTLFYCGPKCTGCVTKV